MIEKYRTIQHLGVIMDGNRRWAAAHGVPVLYQENSERAVYDTVSLCQEHAIPHLSLYALSRENLAHRDKESLQHLFDLLIAQSKKNKEQWRRQNVRIRAIGSIDALPQPVQDALHELEHETAAATGLQLNILLAYGGRQEIAAACRTIAEKAVIGELAPHQIDEKVVVQHLWMAHAPPPDLIIRTGGNARLSNFLLYQAAYSELLFVPYFWPDMTKKRLEDCLKQYAAITRNFGT